MTKIPAVQDEFSRYIWDTKYRYTTDNGRGDQSVDDTWRRVAVALAAVESRPQYWQGRFYHAMKDFCFIPGGRILAGAGTDHRVTLFNCFVMGKIEDSIDGIFDSLKEGALTLQQGGGIGYDFSTLRPRDMLARQANRVASGPLSFMRIWDSMCQTLITSGSRRGAMMATLRCDHPDIEAFIDSKRDRHALRNFNLSVLVTDEFMQAVRDDRDWPLIFPADKLDSRDRREIIKRRWSGYNRAVPCRVFRRVKACTLWEQLVRASYDCAEPGVLFIDRINDQNNLWYREHISATNPCGEIPLPAYGACDLGSINLTRFVRNPFTAHASIDIEAIKSIVPVAVRMLDNVINVSRYPLAKQKQQARMSRRTGLGLTGLADALVMLGHRYGDEASCEIAGRIMQTINHTAYRTSVRLAKEKGAFPGLETDSYINGQFVRSLPADIQSGIRKQGIRNSHLTAIAPAGTISLLAGNVSSGIEPVFAYRHVRYVLEGQVRKSYPLTDYAWQLWYQLKRERPPANTFVCAHELEPVDHLRMQAVMQAHVDNSISKTINIPADYSYSAFRTIYETAYKQGLKSCTVFRANNVTAQVLYTEKEPLSGEHCCDINS